MHFPVLDDIRKQWTEKEFQDQVLAAAQKLGWSLRYHTHNSRRSAPGFPDLVLVHPVKGKILFYELKTEKGVVSAVQWEWINGLRDAGMTAGVRRPRDWHTILVELGGHDA